MLDGTYTVTATSKADPTQSATAYITVYVAGSAIINSFTVSPPLVHAGFLTGLRHCEALAMRWDHIQKATGTFQVPIVKRGAKPGAQAEFKAIFITQEIQELLDRIPKTSEWLFPSQGRSAKSESGHLEYIQDAWERIRKHLGLGKIRLHDFRHTMASELGDQENLNARELKDSMGWKTMQTAMRYMHARERQQQVKLQEIGSVAISCG